MAPERSAGTEWRRLVVSKGKRRDAER